MIKKTITLKILFVVFSVFLVTALIVMVLADYHLKSIIDKSQDVVYREKLEAILRTMDLQVQRLKATGLREAYEEGFKESALRAIRSAYYKSEKMQIYPFIVNSKIEIVLHPEYQPGSMYFSDEKVIKNAMEPEEGDFLFTHRDEDTDWIIFKKFDEWDWIIAYHVPLEIKYSAVSEFRNGFILVMVIISLIALAILSLMITGAIKPIVRLTEASTAMAGGDLAQHVDTSGDDEIGILARSFTHMRNSIREKIDDLARKNEEMLKEITDRKKAEKEREKLNEELMQKNKELEQVVYVTSHDLRTPLVNIEGFSKELRISIDKLLSSLKKSSISDEVKEEMDSIVDGDIQEALHYISVSIARMDSLLSGLLKLSRIGSTELNIEKLDMNRLISSVLNIFKSRIDEIDIKLEISELPPCIGDELYMIQIFSNLVDNSIKYLDLSHRGIIRISGYSEDSQAVYCVEDNGFGIAPEYQAKIFDIFHRLEPSKNKGEGLGLTIVQRAVQRQSGKIWVESEPGKGSKFFISLPGV